MRSTRLYALVLFSSLALLALACGGDGGGSKGGGGVSAAARVQLSAGGMIVPATSGTWPADSDITLDEDLEVQGELIIEPGTRVTVADGVKIVVSGTGVLEANGNEDAGVSFITEAGDRWLGIEVQSGGSLLMT